MIWLAVTVLGFVILGLSWRVASSRRNLPCPAWLAWMVELDNPVFRNNRSTAIIKGLELGPSMSAVDIGCGPGRLTLPMAMMVGPTGKVVAFDIQKEMLDIIREKMDKKKINSKVEDINPEKDDKEPGSSQDKNKVKDKDKKCILN